MKTSRSKLAAALCSAGLLGAVAFFATFQTDAQAQQAKGKAGAVTPGGLFNGYISGTVTGEKGPEAGVWVIAETKDLLTNFIKIVVTDDRGRFVLPELPSANYKVWVRGYGLADSTQVDAKVNQENVALKVNNAKTPQEEAKVYPGNYWLAMLEPPAKSMFPGTGADGNGLGTRMVVQEHWINSIKSECNFCHQLGNALTRSVDHVAKAKPELKTHEELWDWRLGVGVRGTNMYSVLQGQGKGPSLKVYADWTRRIAAGETPAVKPSRPSGIERNIVTTLWDRDGEVQADRSRQWQGLRGERRSRRAAVDRSSRKQRGLGGYPDPRSSRQRSVAFPGSGPSVDVLGQRALVGESAVQPG
jgi:hypothetical protein